MGGGIFLFCLLLVWTEGAGRLEKRFQAKKAVENRGIQQSTDTAVSQEQSPPEERSLEERGRASGGTQSILFLLPVFLAAVLILTLIPERDTPVKWTIVHNAADMIEEMVNDIRIRTSLFFSRSDGAYSMSFAGFGGDGSIKGGLRASGLTQISLEGSRTKSPLYITGSVYDSYIGYGWEQSKLRRPFEGEEYSLNIQEFNNALSQSIYTQEEILQVVRSCRFKLTFEGIKTDTIFQAPLTSNFYSDQKISCQMASDSIVMERARSVGFSYDFSCLDVDWGSSEMGALLRQQAWKQTPTPDALFEERQKFIHENYTVLPGTVTRRVYDLAQEITEGLSTDYDRLKAIETWLCGLTYTTMPDSCPEGRELTDFFLFDSKEGYCTYFATAMAVMGRCVGIPTRYVEGFVTNDSKRYEGQLIELTGDSAHAWTEAYLDNIGWIVFEPTPGYDHAAKTAWLRLTPGEMRDTKPEVQEVEPQAEEPEPAEEQSSVLQEDKELYLVKLLWEAVLLLVVLVCLIVIILLLRQVIRRRRYLAQNGQGRLGILMKRFLYMGELYGYCLEGGETLAAYHKRVCGCLDTPELTFIQVCILFQSIRFGGKTVTDEQIIVLFKVTITVLIIYLYS